MSKQIGIPAAIVTLIGGTGFVLAWSSGFVLAATAGAAGPVTTLLAWRFAPLAVGLVAVVLVTGAARGVTRRAILQQAGIGLLAQTGYCAFVYAAIAAGVTTGTTALVDAVQPLVVATLVGPLLGLRVRGAQWAGLLLGAAGVVLVVRSQFGAATAAPTAYLLPALAMVCLVAATFAERRLATSTPVLVTLTVHVVVSATVFVAVAAATGTLVPPTSVAFWANALLTALIPTLAAYALYWWLLKRLGITALNALLFAVAPTTALAGALLFGEPVTVVTVIGFALCGLGVAAVLISEGRAAREASSSAPAQPAADPAPAGAGPGR